MFSKTVLVAALTASTSAVKLNTNLQLSAYDPVDKLTPDRLDDLILQTSGEFSEFCLKFGHTYLSSGEVHARQTNWLKSKQDCEHTMATTKNHKCGDNEFSDMSEEEKKTHMGFKATTPAKKQELMKLRLSQLGTSTTDTIHRNDVKLKVGNGVQFDVSSNNKVIDISLKPDDEPSPDTPSDTDTGSDSGSGVGPVSPCPDGPCSDTDTDTDNDNDNNTDVLDPRDCTTSSLNCVWGDKYVTPVKNQGSCGSCWAFGAVAVLESAFAIKHENLQSFSEQMILDCNAEKLGCNGGHEYYVYNLAQSNDVPLESDYPYLASQGTCNNVQSTYNVQAQENNWWWIDSPNSDKVKAGLLKGPVNIAVQASGIFMQYESGVITADSNCGTALDHAVVAIGWGTDDAAGEYLVIRNSWGSWWGDNGYARVSMDESANGGQGVCGIYMDVMYAFVE